MEVKKLLSKIQKDGDNKDIVKLILKLKKEGLRFSDLTIEQAFTLL